MGRKASLEGGADNEFSLDMWGLVGHVCICERGIKDRDLEIINISVSIYSWESIRYPKEMRAKDRTLGTHLH